MHHFCINNQWELILNAIYIAFKLHNSLFVHIVVIFSFVFVKTFREVREVENTKVKSDQ